MTKVPNARGLSRLGQRGTFGNRRAPQATRSIWRTCNAIPFATTVRQAIETAGQCVGLAAPKPART